MLVLWINNTGLISVLLVISLYIQNLFLFCSDILFFNETLYSISQLIGNSL